MNAERIVVFGTGKKYEFVRKKYASFWQKLNVTAYLDNNEDLWGDFLDDVPVISPFLIQTLEYDRIILMAAYVRDMKEQLLSLGVSSDKIVLWEQFICEDKHGIFYEYGRRCAFKQTKERILLVTVELGYNGGTLAILHAAKALMMQMYDVTVAAPAGNEKLIQEEVEDNLHIVIVPAICFPQKEEMEWITQFDLVMVNVFQMIRSACMISQYKPVFWWIHECSDKYDSFYAVTRDNHSEFDNCSVMKKINIMAVSSIAKANFNFYYEKRIRNILPLGIPDKYSGRKMQVTGKHIFAVIGAIVPKKAQLVFLEAAEILIKKKKRDLEFWLIGSGEVDFYSEKVHKKADGISQIKFLDELTQEEMRNMYELIDTVVCSSAEETMSMVIIEGMMNKKVCITTDATGIADYIQDGVNGLICAANDAKSLSEKMEWVVENPRQCSIISENARKTYEKYFTMEKFGQRLDKAVQSTMKGWVDC